MTKIVISGGGLGGLYTATRLINEGVKPENITIIEPRGGIYTRPGHINRSTFAKIQTNTSVITAPSSAQHIKELERPMYKALVLKGVCFVTASFIGLQPRTDTQECGVITLDKTGVQQVYPAAYVYDCSGKDAVVAQAVNRHQKNLNQDLVFKSAPLTNINPITDHLVAHVEIANNALIRDFSSKIKGKPVPSYFKQFSPAKLIPIKESLQKLGWHYEAFPTFYRHPQATKNKVCLYMETPPNLPEEKQKEWINLLISIYSDGRVKGFTELKPPTKYESKPRMMGFKSEPYVLSNVFFESTDLPTVIIGFDALKGFDYRSAAGVDSGIECLELMLQHTKIQDGTIKSIDFNAIEQKVFNFINAAYKTDLITRFTSRQESINKGYTYFSKVYEEAIETLWTLESSQIKNYSDTAAQLANQGAAIRFSTLDTRDKEPLKSLTALNNCLELILRAERFLPASNTEAHHINNAKLQKVILHIRLELAALDIADILSKGRESRQRLSKLCKSIQDNFEHLDGNFAHNTVQKKIKEIQRLLNPYAASHSSPSNSIPSLFKSALPFLVSSPPASALSSPFFFKPQLSVISPSTSALRQLMPLTAVSSLINNDSDSDDDILLSLNR